MTSSSSISYYLQQLNISNDNNIDNNENIPSWIKDLIILGLNSTQLDKIYQISLLTSSDNTTSDIIQSPNCSWISSWYEIDTFIKEKLDLSISFLNGNTTIHNSINNDYTNITNEINDISKRLQTLQEIKSTLDKKKESLESLSTILQSPIDKLKKIKQHTSFLCSKEILLNNKFKNIMKENTLRSISRTQLEIILYKMNLSSYYDIFLNNNLIGDILELLDENFLIDCLQMSNIDACQYLYYKDLILAGYSGELLNIDDCIICSHNTSESTIELFNEYGISFMNESILSKKYKTYHFLYLSKFNDFNLSINEICIVKKQINEWKILHERHLADIQEKSALVTII